jgi:hypothetical protein
LGHHGVNSREEGKELPSTGSIATCNPRLLLPSRQCSSLVDLVAISKQHDPTFAFSLLSLDLSCLLEKNQAKRRLKHRTKTLDKAQNHILTSNTQNRTRFQNDANSYKRRSMSSNEFVFVVFFLFIFI